MHSIIIADTSCLILLRKIGAFDLLKQMADQVIISPAIAAEFSEVLPSWMIIRQPTKEYISKTEHRKLGSGEISAINLALEYELHLLVLDDAAARRLAYQLKLHLIGTIGLLVVAKKLGFIPSIIPYLDLIASTDFRASDEVMKTARLQAGE